jgi:hypothetical protein
VSLSFKASLWLALTVGALACLGIQLLAAPSSRAVALAGVLSCLTASTIGLFAKRWAMRRALKAALGVTVGMLFVRAALCGLGAFVARGLGGSAPAFVLSFTCVFFVLVWVETMFLFSAWRSVSGGVAA